MNQKTYYTLAGSIFLIVAIIHLLRIINGWVVTIDNFSMPMWASWIGIVLAGTLAYYGLKNR